MILTWYRNSINPSFVVPIVKRHRKRCFYKPIVPRRPDYYAKPEEVRQWLEWLKSHRIPVYYKLALLLTHTGMRVGEGCGLTWEAIDFERRTAMIVRSVRWDHETRKPVMEESVKSAESVRVVTLPQVVIEMLKEFAKKDGPVFVDNGGELLRYRAIQSIFNRGFIHCGLPWRSTHICRHTFGTLALMATKDLSAVQASLGHRSRSVTEKYAKSIAMHSSETAEKTAALIDLNKCI